MGIGIAVTGSGNLAALVGTRLSGADGLNVTCATSLESLPPSALPGLRAAVLCTESLDVSIASFIQSCRAAGVNAIAAWLTHREALIAHDPRPRTDPTRLAPGCPECARLHARNGGSREASSWAQKPATHRHDPDDSNAAANLVTLAVCKAIDVSDGVRSADAMATALDFECRSVTVEPVRPHYACAVCVPHVPASSHALRAEVLQWRERHLRDAEIEVDAVTLLSRLRSLTGRRFAPFDVPAATSPAARHAVWRFFRMRGVDPAEIPLARATSVQAFRRGGREGAAARDAGTGFDFDDADAAEAIALVESLERLFALSYCPQRRVVNAAYADVAHEALDPRQFPLFAEAQYAESGFPLHRFDPHVPIDWIWGLDFGAGSPVLVPRDLVFASSTPARIYRANSNGAACHRSLYQAVVGAIYETVERDALMVTWLNSMSLPRVRFGDDDPDPWSVRDTLARLDFDLEHVDLGNDLDIPVLLAVLRDRRNPDLLLVDMVAALDPHAQLRKLYRELAQFVHPYLVDEKCFVNRCTLDDDPARVETFPDHLAFYQTERQNRRAAFLTAGTATRRFGQGTYASGMHDAHIEMGALVARLSAKGYRAIVVDCASPMLRDVGLHAVRVLIPGLQPLNCGHRLRVLGGDRAVAVAQRTGYAPRRRTLDDLNPWPHPFW